MAGSRRGLLAAGVALVTLLPFARGLLTGQSFFFRDLAGHFLPLRAFVVEGLRQGQLRSWNPLVHEGEPVSLAPIGYLPDLLQAILPRPFGISLTLALHVPLAALCFMGLARRLGVSDAAAAGGAFVYSLGGFCLSSLNLYVYVSAIAWAPLVSLGLLRSSEGGRRAVVSAAVFVALALSTTGVEIVAQSVALGLLLCSRPLGAAWTRWGRIVASLVLGAALAGVPLLYTSGLLEGSTRGRGFETAVVLAHSVHPLTFLQVLIAGLYGDTSDLATRWWGQNFFPQGFPYVLSLYLGASALALASVGAACGAVRLRNRLLLTALAAAAVCLGRYAGFEALVESLPLLRLFRYPSKAFFLVHVSVALLASLGLEALREGGRPAWRRLALSALLLGAPLTASPWLPALLGAATTRFVAGFFPPEYGWSFRLECLRHVVDDAAAGGLVALCVAGLALLVLTGRAAPRLAVGALAALLAADLLRAGAGLNPMVERSFFGLSPEMSRWAALFREGRARVFSCEPEFQAAFQEARVTLAHSQDVWTFAALAESLVPLHNMEAGVATAMSRDRTMLVPTERTLSARQVACDDFGSLVDPLRRAGVSHVLSVAPLESDALRLLEVAAPRNVAPLRVHVYALDGALPLRLLARTVRRAPDRDAAETLARTPGFQAAAGVAVEGNIEERVGANGRILSTTETPGRLEFSVEVDRTTVLVVRDAFAPGWHAEVDGQPAPLLRADGRHLAVSVPPGTSRVVMAYRPPRLAAGVALTSAAAAMLGVLWVTERRRPGRAGVRALVDLLRRRA